MNTIHFRKSVLSALPEPLYSLLRSVGRRFRGFRNRIIDAVFFPVWLAFQCARHRKKAVVICRSGVLGDVICALPLCAEVRKRHPGALMVFATAADYKKMVLLSRAADRVYGGRSWRWPFLLPSNFNFLGLVEAVYNPQTTDERSPNVGAQRHLIDDLAGCCGFTIPDSNRQPRLYPSPDLIERTQAAYGLAEAVAKGRLLIGINCGRTWPVRMWDAAKWQALVDLIHAEFEAVILQFGVTRSDGTDEFDNLTGVQSMTNRLQSDELAALVAGCRLLVSIDSGPVHLAGAVGTPVVGLFGAVDPRFRLPPDALATGVFSDVPCLFCHHATPRGHWTAGCLNDIRCMKELDVQTVFQAVKSMLSTREKSKQQK